MPTENGDAIEMRAAPFLSANVWHELLSHPDGRDRLFRLVQFTLRLIRGISSGRKKPSTPALENIAAFEMTLASARQLWRMFKWSGFYSKSSVMSLSPSRISSSTAAESLALLQDAFLASYFVLDNAAFLTKTSLVQGDTAATTRWAARAWLAASLLGVLGCARRARALLEDEKRPGSTAEYRAIARREARRQAALMTKFAGDAVVAFSASRLNAAHPILVGACGAMSSLVGLWQIWPRSSREGGRSR
jgi:hypothetical protein